MQRDYERTLSLSEQGLSSLSPVASDTLIPDSDPAIDAVSSSKHERQPRIMYPKQPDLSTAFYPYHLDERHNDYFDPDLFQEGIIFTAPERLEK